MNYNIRFSPGAEDVLRKYKKSNPVVFKKVSKLLLELVDHPRAGIGHPEPLKHGNSVTYSRRITANDRLIYDIYDDEIIVLIISIEGHYNDK